MHGGNLLEELPPRNLAAACAGSYLETVSPRWIFLSRLICLPTVLACGAAPAERATQDTSAAPPPASSAKRVASVHDWTRFGWDASRSSASRDETGINAGNVAALHRQQLTLDGTVDASPIYLHSVKVNGGTHDVFF